MMLQDLYQYYQQDNQAPPIGLQPQKIPFIIHINLEGAFIQFSDTREKVGTKKVPKTFLVPTAVRRTNRILPNLLWDKPEYVLGVGSKNKTDKKMAEAHTAFVAKIQAFADRHVDIPALQALLQFLNHLPLTQLKADPLWPEVTGSTVSLLTFQIVGEMDILCSNALIRQAFQEDHLIQSTDPNEQPIGRCLISGELDQIRRLHPVIHGIKGGISSGSSLVGCNWEAAYSYGKIQGYISPIGERATHAYSTALNGLLHFDSKQKIQLPGTTVVFWPKSNSALGLQFQDQFAAFFYSADSLSRGTSEVRKLYQSPWQGHKAILESVEDHFCVLGLSVSSGSRLAVKFWHSLPLGQLAKTLNQHFEDLSIAHDNQESEFLPLSRLLKELCLNHDVKHLPPNLENAFLESILLGTAYPMAILQALLQRIRTVSKDQADNSLPPVSYAAAALLKAFLNRYQRHDEILKKEMSVSLDETNPGIGYCLGRLFAVLEKIQKDAQGITSIRERFYAAASSRPVVAFSHLMILKNHHLGKMEAPSTVIYYEKLLGNIMSHLKEGFPQHLSLFEQGAFSVGYYHQQQALYSKKETLKISGVTSRQLELGGIE